ncbi:MAG: DsrE family protein [bacterium]
MTITIGCFSSLIGSLNLDFAVKLADAAIRKGHKVNLWFSGNATLIGIKDQKPFKDYSNLSGRIKDLLEKGCEIAICEACAAARGINKGNAMEEVILIGMDWYTARAAISDRVLHIGRE